MNYVKVTPSVLASKATTMDSNIDQYETTYKQLLTTVEQSAGWKGRDSEAYAKRVTGFRDDWEKLVKLLRIYSSLVRQASESYATVQDDLYSQGQRL